MRLIEAVQAMGDLERSALSSIRIERDATGYIATFSIHLKLPHAQSPDLPKGIQMLGWQGWPDQNEMLDWRIPAIEQIKELHNSGICGNLDWHEHGPDRWLIKTHAGSDRERRDWANRLCDIHD